MSTQLDMKMKLKQYEQTVIDYLGQQGGHFIIASDDQSFVGILRATILKQLAVNSDALTAISDPDYILKVIRDTSVRRKNLVVFIERMMHGKDTSLLVRQVKNTFANVKIIVLTGETERQRLVLLHEIGADNFISKPISMNTLIEKIAFTIKPQGKLGQLIDAAKALVAQGNFETALKASRKILELKPNSAAGFLVMGDAWQGLGKLDKARESYEQASDNANLYMEPLKKLADLHRLTGNMSERLRYLEKLDELSPLNVERKVDMGEIHVELGNEERAEELFATAVQQATKDALTYIGEISQKIATVYSSRDPEKAEKYYRQALDAKGSHLDHTDIATFNRLGIALRRQGKWQDAILEYEKALHITPDDDNLMYNMSMAFAEGRQFPQACQTVNRILKRTPAFGSKDKTLSYNIGIIFSRCRDNAEARRFFENALNIDPDFEKARKALDVLQG
ncbi:tetratricopeptide repeat protein [Oleidesulfovibrio sp.]|uniref:tetratricopeptide repeat protein n=1 Tax=Oleidesulfovibrio sp. TaxID=2909707 RepID=UPI003A8B350B